MKWWKKLWEMAGTESGSAKIIAFGCVPITLLNLLLIDETPILNAAMVLLNGIMILLAVTHDDD